MVWCSSNLMGVHNGPNQSQNINYWSQKCFCTGKCDFWHFPIFQIKIEIHTVIFLIYHQYFSWHCLSSSFFVELSSFEYHNITKQWLILLLAQTCTQTMRVKSTALRKSLNIRCFSKFFEVKYSKFFEVF